CTKVKASIFFLKKKTAYEIGLGIPAEPLFRSIRPRILHFMRTLPTGSVEPNFGRRVRNRRQLNSLQNTWPYGYSMPIAVRYTQRSEERRVGKENRCRCTPQQKNKNTTARSDST